MNIGWYSETFARELVKDYDRRTLARREGRGKRKRAPRGIPTAGGGSGNGLATTATPCGCDFVSEGSVDCLGTGDSANVYVVDDLGPLGTNVELTFDASCEWISEDITYNCSGS